MPMDIETHRQLGLDQPIAAEVNGRINGVVNDPAWDINYPPCPEAYPAASAPTGQVHKFSDWIGSQVYPATTRDLWIYTPAVKSSKPRHVIIFNDGAWHLSRKGSVRATHVLDSLHSQAEIEPTVAIFVTPGIPSHPVKGPIDSYDYPAAQRSLEYDSLTPNYGEFIFRELLPFAETELGIEISKQPEHRTMCGISSGGIAAFNVAWQYPDLCRRVLSHCGSFTDIQGGHNFPTLIRKTPGKPIRIYLQSGENDANTPFGDWALANQTMASAFAYASYDFKFEFGTGGHNLAHGGSVFADSLRWLWRQ